MYRYRYVALMSLKVCVDFQTIPFTFGRAPLKNRFWVDSAVVVVTSEAVDEQLEACPSECVGIDT